jgi:hypothetical protein
MQQHRAFLANSPTKVLPPGSPTLALLWAAQQWQQQHQQ